MINTEFLKAPPMSYRPRSYWAWLDGVTDEEVNYQVDRMYNAGMGGFVMHARGGLTVEYTGKEWMSGVKAMIERAKKYGMLAIIDDEHGWPSGFGAGHVNSKGEKYRLKYLLCEEISLKKALEKENTLGLYTTDLERIKDASNINGDTKVIRVYKKIDKYYVDNMDKDVVDAFIDASYDDYNRKLRGFDGVEAIFSDEPQTARYATPWSDTVPGIYKEKYQEDIFDRLVSVFYDKENCEQFRIRLYSIMQECFYKNYAGRIYDWCESHGVKFTGHTCLEDDFVGQIRCSLGTMPFYENMSVPGIDWLCRIPLNNMTILQLTSAAQQTGKKRVLCEMFGCAGWNISFAEMKWLAQWQSQFGINDHLLHLGLYSLRGSRKREYPASIHYQQPWYDELKIYNDYFARVSRLISESRIETDLLVIHPMQSAWATYDGSDHSCDEMLEKFLGMTDDLLKLNLTFHYGDETLIKKHGSVKNGKLVIGECAYDTVLLPDLKSISESTYFILKECEKAGVRLVCADGMPTMIDGAKSIISLNCEMIGSDIDSLAKAFTSPYRIKDNGRTYITRWNSNGGRFMYICNNELDRPADFELDLPPSWYEYDPVTNTTCETPFDMSSIHLDGGQALILFDGDEKEIETKPESETSIIDLGGMWEMADYPDNAFTIDHFALSFDGENYGESEYILDIQKALLSGGKNRTVYLKAEFVSEIETDAHILLEDTDRYSLSFNGIDIDTTNDDGWRYDKSMRAIKIRLMNGVNRIILKRDFTNSDHVYFIKNSSIHEAESNRVTVETELEAICIIGKFALKNKKAPIPCPRNTYGYDAPFVITAPKDTIDAGDITNNGYQFFAGSMSLKKTFAVNELGEKAVLTFDKPDSIITKIKVNGIDAGKLCWAPYKKDITGLLKNGENEIELTVYSSLRNMLGPHYSKSGESYSVGPYSYSKEVNHKQFVPFGIKNIRIDICEAEK